MKGPVEKKVTWATLGSYLGAVAVLAVLGVVSDSPGVIEPLPDILEALIIPLLPSAIAFFSGYKAKHTPRPELQANVPPRRDNPDYLH